MPERSAISFQQPRRPISSARTSVSRGVFIPHRIATDCYLSKQPIATRPENSASMKNAPITQTLAANLAYFMSEKHVTQQDLAKKSGVGQTTISLYLNPESRNATATGQAPSPVLARVAALASALDVELWELLRPLTPTQRDLVKSVDALIAERTTGTQPPMPAPVSKPRRTRTAQAAPRKRFGTSD